MNSLRTCSTIEKVALCLFCCAAGNLAAQSTDFSRTIITTDFISEGVATADVNRDGRKDVLAGGFWFEAPSWTRHEISPARVYDGDREYSHSFLNAACDVNKDGWVDLIVVDFPGTHIRWFENPRNSKDLWKSHLIFERAGNESPAFADVDGDGAMDVICADTLSRQMIWLKSNPGEPWQAYPISEKNAPGTDVFSHGLGWGDINGDGRTDIIATEGWWESPVNPAQPGWIFHEAALGDPCSQMYSYDVNRDGRADVLSASAHLSGIWWHEQQGISPNVAWETHVLSYAFAESHALILADLNGDGHADMITGKRNLKRNTWRKNPGTHGPPLLYWFEYTPAEPWWVAHEIDAGSGAGLNIAIDDMNTDGRPDIIIANFKGVFIFENRLKQVRH